MHATQPGIFIRGGQLYKQNPREARKIFLRLFQAKAMWYITGGCRMVDDRVSKARVARGRGAKRWSAEADGSGEGEPSPAWGIWPQKFSENLHANLWVLVYFESSNVFSFPDVLIYMEYLFSSKCYCAISKYSNVFCRCIIILLGELASPFHLPARCSCTSCTPLKPALGFGVLVNLFGSLIWHFTDFSTE